MQCGQGTTSGHGSIWLSASEWYWRTTLVVSVLQDVRPLTRDIATAVAYLALLADIGGFFGNPEPEMLVRWYQVGAFSPFFRAHAHIDTKRREPYLLDEPYKSMLRSILRLRYSQLPVWYTAFREASVTGLPVLRPHYVTFPQDEAGFAIDDQYFVGSSGLLVKPVVEKGVTEVSVYLPEDQVSLRHVPYLICF